MSFKVIETKISGVLVLEPVIFVDSRGYFVEVYNKSELERVGIGCNFVQDNQSKSKQGVLRGLHFQKKFPQAKLSRVISGTIFDVAVDLRRNSLTYGDWVGAILSSENQKQFFTPRGFAHGIFVLSKEAEYLYKCDEFYHPEDEGGLIFNDTQIGIIWPNIEVLKPILSTKDQNWPSLKHGNILF